MKTYVFSGVKLESVTYANSNLAFCGGQGFFYALVYLCYFDFRCFELENPWLGAHL
ncbi:hypothetical protein HanOQP8_Chr05g0170661 [Helianthus annuus]|nr:hypothetical protein HanOQP8_Chr05g0170661 [Helianthus annuus]